MGCKFQLYRNGRLTMLQYIITALACSGVLQGVLGAPTQSVGGNPNASLPALPPPSGGVQVTGVADYHFDSAFDYESFNLVLAVELIEYDLFGYGLNRWNVSDWEAAGLTADDRALIAFFQQQEIGHAKLAARLMGRPDLSNVTCTYQYPNFTGILDWLDFNQKATRFGESGVYGFLGHLNDRSTSAALLSAISTEARQQFAFRQLEGLFPVAHWFTPGITQSMTWTLLSRHISSCEARRPPIKWNIFPALNIANNPQPTAASNAVAHVTGNLTYPGRTLNLTWETPGKLVGPDLQYVTRSNASEPKYVAWISQLGLNYTRLENINGTSGTTVQPGGNLWFNGTEYTGDPAVNGTMFILVTDANPPLSPFNLSAIETHIVAGPAEYQSG